MHNLYYVDTDNGRVAYTVRQTQDAGPNGELPLREGSRSDATYVGCYDSVDAARTFAIDLGMEFDSGGST